MVDYDALFITDLIQHMKAKNIPMTRLKQEAQRIMLEQSIHNASQSKKITYEDSDLEAMPSST